MRKRIFLFLIGLGFASVLSVSVSSADEYAYPEPPIGLVEPPFVAENPYAGAAQGTVSWNGKILRTTPAPVIVNGSLMLPAKDLFESLGMQIAFDDKRLSLTASKPGLELNYGIIRTKWPG